MGCAMGVLKYLLFIFNFIFVLCGLAILIVGVLVQVGKPGDFSDYVDKITQENNFTVPAITLIVIGSIIFIIAFLGCCGAIRESHCMIVTFACLLLTILIIQVAISIYVFVSAKSINMADIKDLYTKELFNKYESSANEKQFVDNIQEALQCCGIEGPEDFPKRNWEIPKSCCNNNAECSIRKAYTNGCAGALENLFKTSFTILGGVAVGIAAVELIGIIFALCLANSVKNAERRGYSV